MTRLAAHDWPGNVRELANVLESALIVGGGGTIELPEQFQASPRRSEGGGAPTLDASVRVAIERALQSTRGKIYGRDGAAVRLGLKPGTLQSKMQTPGIRRDRFVWPTARVTASRGPPANWVACLRPSSLALRAPTIATPGMATGGC